MDKKSLSERDIRTKNITPAITRVGWDPMLRIREEVGFADGRIIIRGKLISRGKATRAKLLATLLHGVLNLETGKLEAAE